MGVTEKQNNDKARYSRPVITRVVDDEVGEPANGEQTQGDNPNSAVVIDCGKSFFCQCTNWVLFLILLCLMMGAGSAVYLLFFHDEIFENYFSPMISPIGAPPSASDEMEAYTWKKFGEDIQGGFHDDANYGYAVSLSGDGSVLAFAEEGNSLYCSRIFLYALNEDNMEMIRSHWTTVSNSSNCGGNGFAMALSDQGTHLVYGQPGENEVGVMSDVENGVEIREVLHGEDRFGRRVAISSDGTVVAVASLSAVRVYEWGGPSNYTQRGTDIEAGTSIALSYDGSILVVGNATLGLVRSYRWSLSQSEWQKLGQDLESDGTDPFGDSVALSGDGMVLAVGAVVMKTDGFVFAGKVTIYSFSGAFKSWMQLGETALQGYESSALFGEIVKLSGDGSTVAITSRVDSSDVGHVHVYNWDTNDEAWLQVGNSIEAVAGGSWFSIDLSSDGTTLVIGSPNTYRGLVRVYKKELD